MSQYEKYVFDAIYGRRSIRTYLEDKEIEHDKIIKLLKAAMAAPSTCNLQVWEFIAVTEKETLGQLINIVQQYYAPLAMVICANTKNIPWNDEDWKIDCSAAVENMMIAAVSMGLGSVWIGAYDMDAVRKLLAIPDDIKVMNIVYFGYPAKTKKPATKYDEDAVYWQKYDSTRKRSLRATDMITDDY